MALNEDLSRADCPICGKPIGHVAEVPRQVCFGCTGKITDENGRRLAFWGLFRRADIGSPIWTRTNHGTPTNASSTGFAAGALRASLAASAFKRSPSHRGSDTPGWVVERQGARCRLRRQTDTAPENGEVAVSGTHEQFKRPASFRGFGIGRRWSLSRRSGSRMGTSGKCNRYGQERGEFGHRG